MDTPLFADEFKEHHLIHLEKWLTNPAVHSNLYALYRPMNFSELCKWLEHEQKDNAGIFFYHTDNETAVGMGLVHYIHPKHGCGELSIIVNPECSGQGFGRRILFHLMDCAFNTCNLHKIFFHCAGPNKRMIEIAEKAGFVQEGVYREEIHLNDMWYNTYRYGMLEEEYAELIGQTASAHNITS